VLLSKLLIALVVAAICCAVARAQNPPGWKTVTGGNKSCKTIAPAKWIVGDSASGAFFEPADGSHIGATLSYGRMTSWPEMKAKWKHNLATPQMKVMEDSDTRIWLEFPTKNTDFWNIFVARRGNGYYCMLQIDSVERNVRPKYDPVLKRIEQGLTPTK
jgi:hypothetical protein